MEYKIAIIGPQNVISGFKALGVTTFDAQDGEVALELLRKIKKDIAGEEGAEKYAVVLVIESVMDQIPPEELEKLTHGALPAILSLPGIEGTQGAGVAKLKNLAEKAIGSDILG